LFIDKKCVTFCHTTIHTETVMSSKEAILIHKTIETLKKQLENPELTDLEKQAKEFYIRELSEMTPCPDEEIFKKPCANIRGRTTPAEVTDREVFQKFIRLTPKGQPMTNANGEVRSQLCYFKNFESYLKYIEGRLKVSPQRYSLYEGMTQGEYLEFHTPQKMYSPYRDY